MLEFGLDAKAAFIRPRHFRVKMPDAYTKRCGRLHTNR
jgi:hypothetical protein